eukprot:CAMPEP_0205913580 /NCGR_PEP_ID=MMETSP1325-20131115/6630_1 /ASSEMBLY_ACC=CAM_ASM_000708 /TAXON_ID=236786 /ORGANISM="Florenciella sp., Strain RCC1007" /LENGTH=241 /DNA_ID=CAMNT_0053280473 /DNA_START=1 /DNA_END=726 /DNA_ORIENTATION=+
MMDDEEPAKEEAPPAEKKKKPRRRRMMDDEEPAKEEAKPKKEESTAKSGWGSPTKGGEAEGKEDGKAADEEEEAVTAAEAPTRRRKGLRDHEEDNDADVVMIIPDLDEEEAEDLTAQVAVAPKNLARRVQSLQQLDHEIKYTLPSGGGLDLSILTASLVPPEMVQESDATWEFDSLLQEVTQEFTAEMERKAEDAAALKEEEGGDKEAENNNEAAEEAEGGKKKRDRKASLTEGLAIADDE